MTSSKNLIFVSIEPKESGFTAFLSVDAVSSFPGDPARVARDAEKRYRGGLEKMRSLVLDIRTLRDKRRPIPASLIWRLGDAIFSLKDKLEAIGLQLDNLYAHLERDLGVKRKWLEKVIIFRRYLDRRTLVPRSLNWSQCEKGTRRVAERLREANR